MPIPLHRLAVVDVVVEAEEDDYEEVEKTVTDW